MCFRKGCFGLTGLLTWAAPLVGISALWLKDPQGLGIWFLITNNYVGSGTHVWHIFPDSTSMGGISVFLIVWEGKRIFDLLCKLLGKDSEPPWLYTLYPQVGLQCCFVPLFYWLCHTACGLFGILQLCLRKVRYGPFWWADRQLPWEVCFLRAPGAVREQGG